MPSKVEVINTPLPVAEVNTPLPVNAVDIAAKNRFQAQASITTDPNGNITFGSFINPSGNVLVIEFVSGTCTTNAATKIVQLGFQTLVAGVSATHSLMPNFLFSDGSNNYYAISQQTRIYAEASGAISLTRDVVTAGPEVINCSLVISGYLSP